MGRPTCTLLAALAAVPAGCAGGYEPAVRRDLAAQGGRWAPAPAAADDAAEARHGPPQGLADYLRLALERNPAIEAAFERWRASVLRISQARRLPEPTLGLGYFARSVETRVGPQQARISVQQAFPWPTRLTAGADAASAHARALQRQLEAQALTVAAQVATAYWTLWQVRTTRAVHREHLDVIRGLSEAVRARMSTGAARLAEVQQIDLAVARVQDIIQGLDETERAAEARLRAAIGAAPTLPVPTPRGPGPAAVPVESPDALSSLAHAHPMIESWGLQAEASEATARAEAAQRLPSFTLGADWIVTGRAVAPGTPDSGQDAVIVGGGLQIPLWQGSYADSVAAARADARAQRAEQRSLIDRTVAELTSTLAQLRDAARRVDLYQQTLVPQAESAYESVLGAYTVGRGTVAQTLLSQRDLLELRVELERARAEHARTWAQLEALVGRALEPATPPDRDGGGEQP